MGNVKPILTLVAHGGAGARGPRNERAQRRRGLMDAVRRGAELLRAGMSAVDAVVATVAALEDHPLFNAGYGSLLTSAGTVEMDASVMAAIPAGREARTVRIGAGAVGAVKCVRNPVMLARAVMEKTGHLLMVGAGAEHLARRLGIQTCSPRELITSRARERWRARIRRGRAGSLEAGHGTVGAAALDARGGLAAATSTGGIPGKIAGRVGDSAIIGAGVFAAANGAASATGHGEAIILAALCRRAVEALGRAEPGRIAERMIAESIAAQGAEAGLVTVDRRGRVGYAHNAESMEVAIFSTVRGTIHLWVAPSARVAEGSRCRL